MMHGVMVSVTKVRVSPDLSICTAYLSVFPSIRIFLILNYFMYLCSKKQERYGIYDSDFPLFWAYHQTSDVIPYAVIPIVLFFSVFRPAI